MKVTYLEYSKQILQKVSFDPHLFEKELKKAISNLLEAEAVELHQWCSDVFGATYQQIIMDCFNSL